VLKDLKINFGTSDLPRFSCANHKVNIFTRHATSKHDILCKMIRRINTCSKKTRKILQLSKAFSDLKCRLRMNSPTRWMVVFDMIESVLRAIKKRAFNESFKCPVSRKKLEIYHQILKPVYEFTINLQYNNSSICHVLPGLYHLLYEWENLNLTGEPKRYCELLIQSLKKKFDFELNSPIYKVYIFCKFIYV
jgi:hypothetical protein